MSSNDGWIKLHRKIIESSVFDNPHILKMWIWSLSKATHKEHKQMVGLQEVELKIGQFVFGRKVAAKELHLTESNTYRLLKALEKMNLISINSNNKFSIVTIENWVFYQGQEKISNNKRTTSEQQVNNTVTTNEQQTNTNKNVKNDKKEKKEKKYKIPIPSQLPEGVASVEEYVERIALLKGIDVDALRI